MEQDLRWTGLSADSTADGAGTPRRGGVMKLDTVLRELERRRLDAERMHATARVADVLGTVLIDKAVRALQKAAA